MPRTRTSQEYVRLSLAIASFCLFAYLKIDGRALDPTTTFFFLALILAMTGLGGLISDITGSTGTSGGHYNPDDSSRYRGTDASEDNDR